MLTWLRHHHPWLAGLAVTQAAALSVYAGTASPPSGLTPLGPSPSPTPPASNATQPASIDSGMPIAEIAGIAGGVGGAIILTGARPAAAVSSVAGGMAGACSGLSGGIYPAQSLTPPLSYSICPVLSLPQASCSSGSSCASPARPPRMESPGKASARPHQAYAAPQAPPQPTWKGRPRLASASPSPPAALPSSTRRRSEVLAPSAGPSACTPRRTPASPSYCPPPALSWCLG